MTVFPQSTDSVCATGSALLARNCAYVPACNKSAPSPRLPDVRSLLGHATTCKAFFNMRASTANCALYPKIGGSEGRGYLVRTA